MEWNVERKPDRLISLVMACTLGACSLGISAPAANRRRNQMPECDSSKGLVALDSLAAIGFGVGGLAALGEDEGIGAVALVGAALFTAAALHGSGNADKCRAAFADYGRVMTTVSPDDDERPRLRASRPPEPERASEVTPAPATQRTEPPAPEPAGNSPGSTSSPHKPPPPAPAATPAPRDWVEFWRVVP